MEPAALLPGIAAACVLFLAGCAPGLYSTQTIEPDHPELRMTISSPTSVMPTRSPALSPTLIPVPTVTGTSADEAGSPVCPQPVLEAYLARVDPLGAEYLLDAKLAQDAAGLEAAQREEHQRQAEERLDQLVGIIPPDCASQFHQQVIESFTGLVQSWDVAQEGRFEEAQEILRDSYELFAEAAAGLAGYEPQE